MKKDLIESIAKQLNIPRSDDYEWVCQSVYSAAGQMALASLWDKSEEDGPVSIQHFKARMRQIFDAYRDVFPEIAFSIPADSTDIVNAMYDIYLRSGYLYHSANHVSPALQNIAKFGDVTLYRGGPRDNTLHMSGLGFYYNWKQQTDITVAELFGLQTYPFQEYLQELLNGDDWETIEWPENAEFLRIEPPFNRGYWQVSPIKDGRISLARYGEPTKIYMLYRFINGAYRQKTIPEWKIRDYFADQSAGYGEYRRIAIALLQMYDKLPPISIRDDGVNIVIKLGYRLPPSEEDFFKLYTWPLRYEKSEVFTRKMARQIYPGFRHELEALGYCFVEESS